MLVDSRVLSYIIAVPTHLLPRPQATTKSAKSSSRDGALTPHFRARTGTGPSSR